MEFEKHKGQEFMGVGGLEIEGGGAPPPIENHEREGG